MELVKLPMISLQRQALTNFASSVWIRANKQYLELPLMEINPNSMNGRAIAELKRSDTATHIKEMTMMILDDVGDEIFYWLLEIKQHVTDITLEHQVTNLSWTIEGSLNRPKMTRLILENQTDLDLSFSFEMAYTYGLEDKVRELWPRIREEQDLDDFDERNSMIQGNFLVQYWIYKLGYGYLLDPPYSSFLDPLLEGTSIYVQFFVRVVRELEFRKSTVKFLFNNLTEEEKIQALDIIFEPSNYLRDSLQSAEVSVPGYLLSQLNYTQMCALVSKFELPEELLRSISYFAWPNTHFLKALDHCIGKMNGAIEATNGNDLVEFADGEFECVRRYNHGVLFRYCWTRFPREELNKAIDSFYFNDIISKLTRNKDAVSIKMVIDSIDPKSYAKKLLSPYHLPIIEKLAAFDTDLLKYYLARTVVSKNMAKNLLKMLKDSYYLENMETTTGILIQLFPELDPNCSD